MHPSSHCLPFALLGAVGVVSNASAQSPPARAATDDSVVVAADSVRLRTVPSTRGVVLALLRRGTVLAVVPSVAAPGWVAVRHQTRTGYVAEPLVTRRTSTPAVVAVSVDTTPAPAPQAAPPAPTPAPPPVAIVRPTRRPTHRGGSALSLGLLGSVTPVAGVPNGDQTHVAGTAYLAYQPGLIGIYLAPELGSGATYTSVMLGGGLSLRLLQVGPVGVHALGGYTTYAERPGSGASASAIEWSSGGVSLGGLATLRLVGPIRLAYRGQYVAAIGEQTALRFTRHSVGLLF